MSTPRELAILLVEDDDVDVMNVRRAFKKSNITNPLYIASDGIEALELLRRPETCRDNCLLLLDISLPRMNGIELVREMRSDPTLARIPVVVLTASADARDRLEAYGLHVAGYLLKPIDFLAFAGLMAVLKRYWTLVEPPSDRLPATHALKNGG